MDWIGISTYRPLEFPYRAYMSELSLQDELIDLDEITELSDSSVFEFQSLALRIEEKTEEMIIQISFEVDLDLKVL